MTNYYFFLGGSDAEMMEVARALNEAEVPYLNANLGWGAKASRYSDEIAEAAGRGQVPVLVELEVDIDLPEGAVIVDHHGPRAGAFVRGYLK